MTTRKAVRLLSGASGLIGRGYKCAWSTRGITAGPQSPSVQALLDTGTYWQQAALRGAVTSNNTGERDAPSSDSQHATAQQGCQAGSDQGRSPAEQPADAGGEQAAGPSMSPKDMIAVFTCKTCDTRSAKPFSRQAYDTGVVIIQCPGCQARHLIADRLGWFGKMGSVEDFLAEHGEKAVRKREDGTLEITPEDIMGKQRGQSGHAVAPVHFS